MRHVVWRYECLWKSRKETIGKIASKILLQRIFFIRLVMPGMDLTHQVSKALQAKVRIS